MKFAAVITDTAPHNVKVQDARSWDQFKADNAGKDVVLDVRVGSLRSNQANRFLWGVLYANIIERMKQDGTRITAEQLHGYFLIEFLGVVVPDANGEAVTLPGKSSNLNSKEFDDFLKAIEQWAFDKMQMTFPERGEQVELELTETK